jgi:anti-sigma regulatory factor (Ser/Thr protein kinase)
MQAAAQRLFEVNEPRHVGEVRRAALAQAQALGFDDAAASRAALVAAELGTHLARHARHGRLLLAAVEGDDGEPMLELMSLDDGPGVPDGGRSIVDSDGLVAARRMSALFELHSAVPQGTLMVARIGAAAPPPPGGPQPAVLDATPRLQCGAAMLCAADETACGEAWALERDDERCALLLADGLAGGACAAEAVQAAVNVFREDPWLPPGQAIERVQQVLGSTRPAAVCVVQADLVQRRLQHAGAGNVAARLVSAQGDLERLSEHKPQADWPPHTLLVVHSDGIASHWQLGEERTLLKRHPALLAAWLLRHHLRCGRRDDATAVVLDLRHP